MMLRATRDPKTGRVTLILTVNPPDRTRPVYDRRRDAMVYDVEGVVVSRKPLFKEV